MTMIYTCWWNVATDCTQSILMIVDHLVSVWCKSVCLLKFPSPCFIFIIGIPLLTVCPLLIWISSIRSAFFGKSSSPKIRVIVPLVFIVAGLAHTFSKVAAFWMTVGITFWHHFKNSVARLIHPAMKAAWDLLRATIRPNIRRRSTMRRLLTSRGSRAAKAARV